MIVSCIYFPLHFNHVDYTDQYKFTPPLATDRQRGRKFYDGFAVWSLSPAAKEHQTVLTSDPYFMDWMHTNERFSKKEELLPEFPRRLLREIPLRG